MKPAFVHVGKLPDMNQYQNACRSHWSKGAAMKRDATELLTWEMVAQKVPRYGRPLRVTFKWYEPKSGNNKRRDLDNIAFAHKCIFDAMDKDHAKVIHDDSPNHIVEITDILIPSDDGYRMEMYVQEVERGW